MTTPITITVEYSGQLRLAAGQSEERLSLPAALSVKALLQTLADRHDPELAEAFYPGGTQQLAVCVFVNGRQWQGEETSSLRDGSLVSLLSPISGG